MNPLLPYAYSAWLYYRLTTAWKVDFVDKYLAEFIVTFLLGWTNFPLEHKSDILTMPQRTRALERDVTIWHHQAGVTLRLTQEKLPITGHNGQVYVQLAVTSRSRTRWSIRRSRLSMSLEFTSSRAHKEQVL